MSVITATQVSPRIFADIADKVVPEKEGIIQRIVRVVLELIGLIQRKNLLDIRALENLSPESLTALTSNIEALVSKGDIVTTQKLKTQICLAKQVVESAKKYFDSNNDRQTFVKIDSTIVGVEETVDTAIVALRKQPDVIAYERAAATVNALGIPNYTDSSVHAFIEYLRNPQIPGSTTAEYIAWEDETDVILPELKRLLPHYDDISKIVEMNRKYGEYDSNLFSKAQIDVMEEIFHGFRGIDPKLSIKEQVVFCSARYNASEEIMRTHDRDAAADLSSTQEQVNKYQSGGLNRYTGIQSEVTYEGCDANEVSRKGLEWATTHVMLGGAPMTALAAIQAGEPQFLDDDRQVEFKNNSSRFHIKKVADDQYEITSIRPVKVGSRNIESNTFTEAGASFKACFIATVEITDTNHLIKTVRVEVKF